MASMDDEFRHESLQDTESIRNYLQALLDGFENGRILFGTRKKKLILEPNGLLNLAVKARRKNKEVRISVKINWKEEKDGKDAGKDLLEIKPGKKKNR
ncbi:MAG: amphi-Trp domain-containing protein [Candidatus Nitronauta litoralis]|uniref:Amphi-Trp domain-containing protein n=1 Tax=Candidatus Nitronauta litoralis TaxID=2705533 RepID=A0A7T0BX04_9BACT|nr:MAG: amphi-Trp domain-containing protein [Candidatus Nitronauta litoralis]